MKRRIRRRALRRARPCGLLLSPPFSNCRHVSAPRSCFATFWAGRPAKHPNLLGGSIASVNSALQRARETLARRYPDGRPRGAVAAKFRAAGAAQPLRAGLGRARSRRLRRSPQRRGDLHHAAVAAMVRRAGRDRRVRSVGLELRGRASPGADGGQRATGIRRLCSHGSGAGVGRPRPSSPGPRQ